MSYTCFKCNKEVEIRANSKVGMRESCACGNDLHCCKNCEFYDIKSYNNCRESNAERVLDKERYNRCDYFKFRSTSDKSNTSTTPKKKLDDLFK